MVIILDKDKTYSDIEHNLSHKKTLYFQPTNDPYGTKNLKSCIERGSTNRHRTEFGKFVKS